MVDAEINRLKHAWSGSVKGADSDLCSSVLGDTHTTDFDRFDRVQLEDILTVCRRCQTMSEAGRELFAVSRTRKESGNDADRQRKHLGRFALTWAAANGAHKPARPCGRKSAPSV